MTPLLCLKVEATLGYDVNDAIEQMVALCKKLNLYSVECKINDRKYVAYSNDRVISYNASDSKPLIRIFLKDGAICRVEEIGGLDA